MVGLPTIDAAMPSLTHIEDAYPAVAESGHFNPRMEDVEYGALDGLLGYAVRRAQLRVYEDFVRSLQAWNITPPRFSAMTVIAHNPDLKLTELAGILGVAARGGAAGRYARSDGHGRAAPVAGGPARLPAGADRQGAVTLRDITEVVVAHDARVTAHLSADERRTLLELLNKLAAGPA